MANYFADPAFVHDLAGAVSRGTVEGLRRCGFSASQQEDVAQRTRFDNFSVCYNVYVASYVRRAPFCCTHGKLKKNCHD